MSKYTMLSIRHELRLAFAQAEMDKAHEDVRIHTYLFGEEVAQRLPDNDDWDDTLFATAEALRKASDQLREARKIFMEGS